MSGHKIWRPKRWLTIVIVAALALPAGYCFLKLLGDRLNEKLISAKMYHETTGTVVKKEVVKFDEKNHSYVNDLGNQIETRPGDVQYRVYFYFDEFNGYEEPFRSQLMQTEKKRISDGRPRFTWRNYNDQNWYDTVRVGDKLIVSYKAYSDGMIDVRHAERVITSR